MTELTKSLFTEKSPLKIMQTLQFIQSFWVFNTYEVGVDKVLSFLKLTRLGHSWHLINSSALPLHKTNDTGAYFSPLIIQKETQKH